MKFSEALRSRRHEFKISKRSLAILRKEGVNSISMAGCGYAYVYCRGKVQPMHRALMRALGHKIDGLEIDHKNNNKLDNRLFNLRIVTRKQNGSNLKHGRKKKYSHFKGVCFDKRRRKWVSFISPNGVQRSLGRFNSPEAAAIAYNAAAKKYFGKYAKLNCIETRNS